MEQIKIYVEEQKVLRDYNTQQEVARFSKGNDVIRESAYIGKKDYFKFKVFYSNTDNIVEAVKNLIKLNQQTTKEPLHVELDGKLYKLTDIQSLLVAI